MTQPNLFEIRTPEPEAPYCGTTAATREKSRAAARAVDGRADTLRDRVLWSLVQAGQFGATDVELQARLGMDGNTERPRRKELLDSGLIRDSGLTRPTPSGRASTVWVAVGNN